MTTGTVNRSWRRWLDGCKLADLARVLERECRLCRAPVPGGGGLCPSCRDALPWHTAGCPRCGDLRTPARQCGQCLQEPPAFEVLLPAFVYRDEVATLIRRFKHGGELSAGRLLSEALASRLPAGIPETLIPMPLDNQRLRQRGFNQAAEIARRLPGNLRHDIVARQPGRQPQQYLAARQRRRNIRGAFQVIADQPPARVTVVDDVVTTGATAREIAVVLARAGVREIVVCCLARA